MKCPWCKDKPITITTPLGLIKHVESRHPNVSEKALNLALEVLKKERQGDFKYFKKILKRFSP